MLCARVDTTEGHKGLQVVYMGPCRGVPVRLTSFSSAMDWFQRLYLGREVFQDPQEELAYRENQRAFTRTEAYQIATLLRLDRGSRIVDLYCGNGRHAMALAEAGLKVVGIDISRSRISFAGRWARDEGNIATFLVADARALPLIRAFHAVLVLGGAFTHCVEDREAVSLLCGIARVLLPGGILFIDNPNPLRLWRIRYPEGTEEQLARVTHFDLPLGRGDSWGIVRYHCLEQMIRLLREAGFEITRTFGDREGGRYEPKSPRMIVIGRLVGTS